MLKTLHAEWLAPALRAGRRAGQIVAVPLGEAGRSRDNPVEATFVSRALLNKPGSEKETWHIEFDLTQSALDYNVGDAFGFTRPTIRRWSTRSSRRSTRRPTSRSAAAPLRDVLTDGVSLSPAPDMLFQLYSYITGGERRRRPRRSATARIRTATPRRSTYWRDREVPRRAARSGGLHRGARSAAAAALFDLVVAEGAISSRVADRRYGALRRSTSARGSASPRPSSATGSSRATRSRSTSRRRTRSACRPTRRCRSSWSAPAPASRRSGLPPRAHGDQGARPQLAVLRPPAARLRLLLRGRVRRHEGCRRADAAVARLVARRHEKFYVQNRMAEVGRELWSWIADGAIYVCGDAQRMAKDVERALVDIVACTARARSTRRSPSSPS